MLFLTSKQAKNFYHEDILGIGHNYHHFHIRTKRTEGGEGGQRACTLLKNVDIFQTN